MNRGFVKFICLFIPSSKIRKEFRKKMTENSFLPIENNNSRKKKIQFNIIKYWENKTARQDNDEKITCPLCHSKDLRTKFEVFKSFCIFGGGDLIRYKCPHCGVIFGPFKVLNLSEKELSDDYGKHYQIYSEGDSSLQQIEAFFKLNPNKNGKYLNFGCGNSEFAVKTLNEIRKKGYEIYGYDPYAITDDPTIKNILITDKNELLKMRFDGILTNNVLEHMFDPIGNTKFLLDLLKPSGSLIHSTACIDYIYPHTRFHVFFFTGDSIAYIAKKLHAKFKLIPKSEMIHMENGVIFTK